MISFSQKTTSVKPAFFVNRGLLVLLILALILTLWAMLQDDNSENIIEVIEQTSTVKDAVVNLSNSNIYPSKKRVLVATQQPLIPWQKLERAPLDSQPHDLFKVHSWLVLAPAKKIQPQRIPEPVAPPVPFTYVGKLDNSPTGTQFFLMENGRLFSVLKGEKINQQWRLEGEDANSLRLIFLPLNSLQTLTKEPKSAFLAEPVPESQADESLPAELNL